jgi:bacterioferritin
MPSLKPKASARSGSSSAGASASKEAMACLNEILQAEMAGIIRYLHYSFMIMGHNRIPIQKWFRDRASEAIQHSVIIGEKITSLGGHPPTIATPMVETNQHGVHAILEESLEFELVALNLYKRLVALAGDDIALEELARDFVRQETEHTDEVRKMLRSS